MLTSESLIFRPGCLAENLMVMPSSGWIRNTIRELGKLALVDVAKQHARCLLELDGNLGLARRHGLARADIERHVGPAPIVDEQLQRDVGFRPALRVDVRRLPIGLHRFALDLPEDILAADGVTDRLRRRHAPDRFDDFGLLGAHRVGIERVRRLHRHHGEQLKHVVGHHVPQRTSLVVELPAGLDADRLGRGDLHVGRCDRGSRSART